MAPEATLARSGGVGKSYPIAKISPPAPGLVVRREKCPPGATTASPRPCSTDVYRRLKRRLGRTLRGLYCKRRLVRTRKSPPYKLSRVESSLPGPLGLRASLQGSDSVDSHGHHCVSYINKEGGMRSGSLCALLWRLLSWCLVLRARHIPGHCSDTNK